jgi:hypothetical protein
MSQTDVEPDRRAATGTPLWVKVFGIVVIVLVLAFAVHHLTSNGMGPGMHMPPNVAGTQQP